jgi:hypothetical protein
VKKLSLASIVRFLAHTAPAALALLLTGGSSQAPLST